MEYSQKQIEQLPLNNLSIAQFLNLAMETSNQLGWVFGSISETGFIAWNAEVKLKINEGIGNLQSESRGDGVTDVRGNKKNLQNFISTFNGLKKALAPDEPSSNYKNSNPFKRNI